MEILLTGSANPGLRSTHKPRVHQGRLLALFGASLLICASRTLAQEWPAYGGDPGGTKCSPLEQINKKNVQKLKVAWVFGTGDVSDGTQYPTRSALEATPLVVDGVLYVTTAFCRLIALDAETGEKHWAAKLPASGMATPMTFMCKKTGKQFVVIAAGGGNKYDKKFSGKLVAFSLP